MTMTVAEDVRTTVWKTRLFYLLIFSLYLSYETVLFHIYEQYAALMVIRLAVPLALLVLFRKIRLAGLRELVLALCLLFICNMVVVTTIFTENMISSAEMGARYLVLLSTFFVFLFVFHPRNFGSAFLTAPLYLMLGLSALALVPFVCFRLGGGVIWSGMFDYIPYDRLSSLFKEPSLFACNLEYPLLMSWGIYRCSGRRRYALLALFFGVCLYLSESVAGMVAILFAVLFFGYVRWHKHWAERKGMSSRDLWFTVSFLTFGMVLLAFFTTTVFVAVKLMEMKMASGGAFRGSLAVFNFLPNRSLWEQDARIGDWHFMWEQIKKHPFGVGIIFENDSSVFGQMSSNPGGVTVVPLYYWLMTTGVTGVSLLLVIFFCVLRYVVLPAWRGKISLLRYAGMAWVAINIHHLSYGRWLTFNALYVLAICLALKYFELLLLPRQRR